MATSIKYPTSINATQKTLDSQLLAGATSAVLNSATGIQNKAGVFVVDRVDSNNNLTPTKREYISFTGVSTATLTGLTRNADGGSSDQDHAVGAIVEFVSDILQQQALIDGLLQTIDTTGSLDATKVLPTSYLDTTATLGTSDVKIPSQKAVKTYVDSGTVTITNKRITKRIATVASAATVTPTSDDCEIYTVTAQGEAVDIAAPSGTPTNGQTLLLRILDNGTARAITWHTGSAGDYRFSTDLTAPSTTVLSKTLYIGFIYNSAASRWDCVAILNNF
jgi:hypothetical protein